MSQLTLGRATFALMSQRYLGEATDRLAQVNERLSSGQRINRASDDAAGLAIASGLGIKARVYTQGVRNVQDALSALSIADSATEQLGSILMRIKDLAAQSANGTLSLSQRLSLDQEASQLTKEFNRLTASTKFNGLALLDGSRTSYRIQGGYGVEGSLNLGISQELSRRVGTGSFSSAYTFATSSDSAYDTADFDGDGDLDILVADTNQIRVLGNDGNGNFSTTLASYVVGGLTDSARFIDYDEDGDLDVVGGLIR